ncbi:MAG: hypothetical protein ACE5F1_18100 [Planctomycetota bacterium]
MLAGSSPIATTTLVLLLTFAPAAKGAVQSGEISVTGVDGEQARGIRSSALASLQVVEKSFGHSLGRSIELVMLSSEREIPAELRKSFQSWAVAVTSTHQYRVHVLRNRLGSAPPNNLRSVLIHEFAHVFLGDLELELSRGERRLPVWFHEGLAQELAGSTYLSGQEELVAVRLFTDQLISWRLLRDRLPEGESEQRAAYAQCASFFSFLVREIGLELIMKAAGHYLAGRARNLDEGLAFENGQSFTGLGADWERYLAEGRGILALLRRSCFEILLVLCVPLLFLVIRRRNRSERLAALRLAEFEAAESEDAAETRAGEPAEEEEGH